jgi:hypothetical protein
VLTRVGLVFLLWVTLGGWIGALLLFATVVAPTAFEVLPSPEMAGRVVSPALRALHLYGGFAGLAIAGITLALGRGIRLSLLALLLSGASFYSHFGVTSEISELRDLALGPEPQALAQRRFAELHRRSVWIYGALGLGATGLAALHAYSEVHQARSNRDR